MWTKWIESGERRYRHIRKYKYFLFVLSSSVNQKSSTTQEIDIWIL
jgi:hypothetical protein